MTTIKDRLRKVRAGKRRKTEELHHDQLGRILAHAYHVELECISQELINNIPTELRELVAEAAIRWTRLVHTGPTETFNKAQEDLVLSSSLLDWYLTWLNKKRAEEGG